MRIILIILALGIIAAIPTPRVDESQSTVRVEPKLRPGTRVRLDVPDIDPVAFMPLVNNTNGAPSNVTFTRASSAFCEQADGQWTEAMSGLACFDGAMRVNNYCPAASHDLTGWSAVRASIGANAAVAPDGTTRAEALIEDGTAAQDHYISGSTGTLPDFAAITGSVYVKAAARTWAMLYVNGATTATAYINLSTCALGTTTGTGTPFAEDAGGGWCRVGIADHYAGTSCTGRVYAAEADNDVIFDGLSQTSIYVWWPQLTTGGQDGECWCDTAPCTCTSGHGALSVWPAVTNYVGDSLDATAWTAVGTVTVTADQASGLFSGYNGGAECELVDDTTAASGGVEAAAVADTSTGDFSGSVIMASGTLSTARIFITNEGGAVLCSATKTLTAVPTRYYLDGCTMPGTQTSANLRVFAGSASADTGTIYVCGAQFEKAASSSRPCVCTTSAACTCAADVATVSTASWPVARGSVEFNYTPENDGTAPAFRLLLDSRSGAPSEGLYIWLNGTTLTLQVYDGGVAVCSRANGSTTWTPGQSYAVRAWWNETQCNVSIDGASAYGPATATGALTGHAATAYIGARNDGAIQATGSISHVRVYP